MFFFSIFKRGKGENINKVKSTLREEEEDMDSIVPVIEAATSKYKIIIFLIGLQLTSITIIFL